MKRLSFIGRILAISIVGSVLLSGRAMAASMHLTLDFSKFTFTNSETPGTPIANLAVSTKPLPPRVVVYKPGVWGPVVVNTIDGAPIDLRFTQTVVVVQLLDANGEPMGNPTEYPVTLQKMPGRSDAVHGVAYTPLEVLQVLHPGDAIQVSAAIRQGIASKDTPPYTAQVVDTLAIPVDQQDVSFTVPDTQQIDQPTAGNLAVSVLPSEQGTIIISKVDPITATPFKGMQPVSAFSFNFIAEQNPTIAQNGAIRYTATPLKGTMNISLSYPAFQDGAVAQLGQASRASAFDLAPYCFDPAIAGWRLVGRGVLDSTNHTVRFTSAKMATCALFLTGPVTSADLRPKERIITPNGDGINDTATFAGPLDNDEVHIFDMRGRRVCTVHGGVWDGRDDAGKIVESGVYIFQYKSLGERTSGVIVVAK